MTKAELQNIIDQFDEDSLKKEAVFGIFQFGGGSDESFIKANKEGLTLFAIQLLKSAKDIEESSAQDGKKTLPFDYEEDWIDGDSNTFVQYIEFAKKKDFKKENTGGVSEKLFSYGCVFALLVFLLLAITGLITLFKWFF